ncbi:aldo/keto reductase [Alcanivorax xiamenensis]|uniref:Aldo/keto reductase n=1 Tax=Alcanivorax xiamenensis TaxID=1177156 RepID=A0ABQ6YA52_9GAMM|nr:aldo/keto reductase [Alcanivorax xiamenensis]KAF0806510.1 aldo/keto reductase [Alcanivorax xiamenensis]
MLSRRTLLQAGAASAAGLMLSPLWAAGEKDAAMAARTIPSSGEAIPVIGMGSSGSFEVGTSDQERDPLREVLRRFFAGGGRLIDTAPSYGSAETVIGDLLSELELRQKTFLATKISSTGREAGKAQFENSLRRLKTDKVELLQVHNMQDWQTQMALINDLKKEGKVRYSGVTHWLDGGQDQLAEVVEASKPDFLQINYSVISAKAEERLFPLARDLGVAVLINRAFDDGRLFRQVADRPLPEWAPEAGIDSWAQAFLKFSISHPAVTAVIPATGKPHRQSDNLKAGYGPMLTEQQRRDLRAIFS